MKTPTKTLWPAVLLAALLPFALGAQNAQPQKPQDGPTPTKEAALHEIGAPAAPEAAAAPAAPAQAPAPPAPPAPERRVRHGNRDEDNRVSVDDSTYVGPDETVAGNAVAVLGPLTVDGAVEGNAVAVLGPVTINGTIQGNTVAVLGDMKLGPKARVEGNVVAVGGHVDKDPSAYVGGAIVQQVPVGGIVGHDTARSWWKHGLRMGRPLAIGPHLHLFWIITLLAVALYALLALVFPGGVMRVADTIERRPGITFLTGILAILATPFLFILLCVTVVGIPVAFVVLPLAIVTCSFFGKAGMCALVGRAILGRQAHAVLAVLLGAAIFIALFLVPILGLMVWFFVGFLGFAAALTALFTSNRPAAGVPAAPAAGVAAPPAAGGPAAPAAAFAAAVPAVTAPAPAGEPASAPIEAAAPIASAVPPALAAPAVVQPPLVAPAAESGYPRAGFWIRMVALLIDVILIAIIFHVPVLFFPAVATYGAILWKLRGATIGGIIFGLKVVRVDGRPMDWVTACVRALSCFFSAVVIGLGFLWIAFDADKQAWHDKIAGTLVVRVPKGVSLV